MQWFGPTWLEVTLYALGSALFLIYLLSLYDRGNIDGFRRHRWPTVLMGMCIFTVAWAPTLVAVLVIIACQCVWIAVRGFIAGWRTEWRAMRHSNKANDD